MHILNKQLYAGIIKWGNVIQEGIHESIVTKEQFDNVQKIKSERIKDKSKRNSVRSEYFLTRNIFCGSCGSKMIGYRARKKGLQYIYYACSNRLQYGKEECAQELIRPSGSVASLFSKIHLTTHMHRHYFIIL